MNQKVISAVIICSPGEGDGYLPGTLKDAENLANYLRSPKGGRLEPAEVTTLIDPGWREALTYINNVHADYQVVYFSGHGGTQNGQRLLAFKDGKIPDTAFLNHNPRQLIMIDACRNYLPAMGSIPEADDLYSNYDGSSDARRVLEWFIEQSPAGKMIVHATHAGAYANDIAHLGGAFTFTLLRTAIDVVTSEAFSGVFIQQLLPLVKLQLDKDSYGQNPGITYAEGDLRVPFLIDAPQIVMKKEAPVREPANNRQQVSPLAVLAFLIALAGIAKLFSE